MKFKLVEDIEEYSNEVDSEGNPLTKEQAEFFKNSKVRDSQGRLLVCYRRDSDQISEFDKTKSKRGWLGNGFYFSTNKQYIRKYGKYKIDAYLNIRNPYYFDSNDHFSILTELKNKFSLASIPEDTEILELLIDRGYDGMIYTDWDSDIGTLYVAFEPNQIKSITNKIPTNSNNINEETLVEVYPNKGESKKDFIARFMKVTKDEYPDVKQRYAVANSYWDRRDKKKVNEGLEEKSWEEIERFLSNTKIENNRFNIKQFTKYKGDDGKFVCLTDGTNILSIAFLKFNSLNINDVYLNEIQTIKKGYGKPLIQELIKKYKNFWLMAEPGSTGLVDYYRQFNLEEFSLSPEKSIYNVKTYFFYKFDNASKQDAINKIQSLYRDTKDLPSQTPIGREEIRNKLYR